MRMLRLKDAQIHRARIVCWALDEIRSDSHTTTRQDKLGRTHVTVPIIQPESLVREPKGM